MVNRIGGVSINNPKGVEGGAERRLIGGDVEGEDVIHPIEFGEHGVIRKERHMNVGSHTWLPNRGKKGLETVERGKVSLVDRWILQQHYRGVGGRFSEQLKQRNKNIPAPKAVMLNDGKKRMGRGRPLTRGRRHGLIIHFRAEPDKRKMQGKGLVPPGGEDHQNPL